MPVKDFVCPKCEARKNDQYVKVDERPKCEACGTAMESVMNGSFSYQINGNNTSSTPKRRAKWG